MIELRVLRSIRHGRECRHECDLANYAAIVQLSVAVERDFK